MFPLDVPAERREDRPLEDPLPAVLGPGRNFSQWELRRDVADALAARTMLRDRLPRRPGLHLLRMQSGRPLHFRRQVPMRVGQRVLLLLQLSRRRPSERRHNDGDDQLQPGRGRANGVRQLGGGVELRGHQAGDCLGQGLMSELPKDGGRRPIFN